MERPEVRMWRDALDPDTFHVGAWDDILNHWRTAFTVHADGVEDVFGHEAYTAAKELCVPSERIVVDLRFPFDDLPSPLFKGIGTTADNEEDKHGRE